MMLEQNEVKSSEKHKKSNLKRFFIVVKYPHLYTDAGRREQKNAKPTNRIGSGAKNSGHKISVLWW